MLSTNITGTASSFSDSDNQSVITTDMPWLNKEEYLTKFDESFAKTVFPAIFFLGVLMVVGIVGNIAVLYVYTFRMHGRGGTVTRFIQALAVFDLLSCCLAIPGEIMDMKNNYTFGRSPMCKLVRTMNLFCTLSSGITLIVVAIDRYKRICLPLKRQISPSLATIIVCAATVIALVLSTPTAIIYGSRKIATDHPHVTGMDCSIEDRYIKTALPLAYNAMQMLLFLTGLCILIVLYILIARRIWQHEHQRIQRRLSIHIGNCVGLDENQRFPVNPSDAASSSSPTTELASPIPLSAEEKSVLQSDRKSNNNVFFRSIEKSENFESPRHWPKSSPDVSTLSDGTFAIPVSNNQCLWGRNVNATAHSKNSNNVHAKLNECVSVKDLNADGTQPINSPNNSSATRTFTPSYQKDKTSDKEKTCDGDSGISTESLSPCSNAHGKVSFKNQSDSNIPLSLNASNNIPLMDASYPKQMLQNSHDPCDPSAKRFRKHSLEKDEYLIGKSYTLEKGKSCNDNNELTSQSDSVHAAGDDSSNSSPKTSNEPHNTCGTYKITSGKKLSSKTANSEMFSHHTKELTLYKPLENGEDHELETDQEASNKSNDQLSSKYQDDDLSFSQKDSSNEVKFSPKKYGHRKGHSLNLSIVSVTRSEGDHVSDCCILSTQEHTGAVPLAAKTDRNSTKALSTESTFRNEPVKDCSKKLALSTRSSLRARLANSTTNLLGKLMSNEKSLSEWDATLDVYDIQLDTVQVSGKKHPPKDVNSSRPPKTSRSLLVESILTDNSKHKTKNYDGNSIGCKGSQHASGKQGDSDRIDRKCWDSKESTVQLWHRHSFSGDSSQISQVLKNENQSHVCSEKKVLFRNPSLGKADTQENTGKEEDRDSQVQINADFGRKELNPDGDNNKVTFRNGRRGSSLRGFKDLKFRGFSFKSDNPGIRRTTLILFLISLVYIVSFLPHLVMMTVKSLDPQAVSGESEEWILASNLIIRSYFLNSVANPFIYTFFSRNFFRKAKESFSCLRKIRSGKR
ncbi:cholecystokinin receptor [Plakobranchus ocellatus]|uniref:Cholecystokinin receptor n=1 Tax=Plakobranchus ocellatus TaxID=259542 RepID=A0AAV4ARW0_9GAST|nr:cholecystokinin receptor [Plakobranchus ocellatus]